MRRSSIRRNIARRRGLSRRYVPAWRTGRRDHAQHHAMEFRSATQFAQVRQRPAGRDHARHLKIASVVWAHASRDRRNRQPGDQYRKKCHRWVLRKKQSRVSQFLAYTLHQRTPCVFTPEVTVSSTTRPSNRCTLRSAKSS